MAPKSGRVAKPPVVLAGGLVEQFAVIERTVTFRGQGMVFTGDVAVGSVPRLALLRHRREILLVLCDRRWEPIAIGGGGATIRAVKSRAERMYQGVGRLWRPTDYTRAQARAVREREMKQPGYSCSVCRKPWYEVRQIITAGKPIVSLCDKCVREMHALLSPSDDTLNERADR